MWDTIPDPLDRWNFRTKFPVAVLDVTDIEPDLIIPPADFVLEQNYPNPFNPIQK